MSQGQMLLNWPVCGWPVCLCLLQKGGQTPRPGLGAEAISWDPRLCPPHVAHKSWKPLPPRQTHFNPMWPSCGYAHLQDQKRSTSLACTAVICGQVQGGGMVWRRGHVGMGRKGTVQPFGAAFCPPGWNIRVGFASSTITTDLRTAEVSPPPSRKRCFAGRILWD